MFNSVHPTLNCDPVFAGAVAQSHPGMWGPACEAPHVRPGMWGPAWALKTAPRDQRSNSSASPAQRQPGSSAPCSSGSSTATSGEVWVGSSTATSGEVWVGSSTATSGEVGVGSSSSSSSSSAQDRLIGPLPEKCWPEALYATFTAHSERGRQDRMKQTLRYHYQYHNYLPPALPPPNTCRWRGGGRKYGGRTSVNSVTLSLTLIQISTSNFRRHYQPHARP